MGTKVDFLCIGAQKAATSWLWDNMKKHPGIWVPFRKELHYFDRSPRYPSPSDLSFQFLSERFFSKKASNSVFFCQFLASIKMGITNKNWQEVLWNLRFFLGTYNDAWYQSLFYQGRGKVKGEVTPSYSILDMKDVGYIKHLFPDLKIIWILRNPIDRAWSQIRSTKNIKNYLKDVECHFNEITNFIDSKSQTLRSDYVRTFTNWTSFFDLSQMHIGFYDDLMRDPEAFLLNIYAFLGVETTRFQKSAHLNGKVNVSRKMHIPSNINHYLVYKYYPEIEQLNKMVGGQTSNWLDEISSNHRSLSTK